ncbi:MAG: HlyD family secretion protein, partial [Trueperaceae bacterium]|nr:HlyD family secretion protein [Trueperaceae bacterium]
LAAEQAPAQVERAEADARRAAAALTQAEAAAAAAEVAVAQAEASLAVAEAQRRQATAAAASAEVALAQRTLRAPFAGRVLAAPLEVGEAVGPNAPTIRIGDVGGWRVVTTNLTERQVTGLTPGARVRVAIDAVPGRTFDGTVERVAYDPRLVRGDVTYEAVIGVGGAALDADVRAALRPGMTAVVRELPSAGSASAAP